MSAAGSHVLGLIKKLNEALPSEIALKMGKEAAKVTLFQHIASVASTAYSIAEAWYEALSSLKMGLAIDDLRSAVAKILRKNDIPEYALKNVYCEIVFIGGCFHDYNKLEESGGNSAKFLEELFSKILGKELFNENTVKVFRHIARALEAGQCEELPQDIERHIVAPIRIADAIHVWNASIDKLYELFLSGSSDSIYSQTYRRMSKFMEIRFLKVLNPTILTIISSKRILEELERRGYRPIAIFHDGLAVACPKNTPHITYRELVDIIMDEYARTISSNALETLSIQLQRALNGITRIINQVTGVKAEIQKEKLLPLFEKYQKLVNGEIDEQTFIQEARKFAEEAKGKLITKLLGIALAECPPVAMFVKYLRDPEDVGKILDGLLEKAGSSEHRKAILAYWIALASDKETAPKLLEEIFTKIVGIPPTRDAGINLLLALNKVLKCDDEEKLAREIKEVYINFLKKQAIYEEVNKFISARLYQSLTGNLILGEASPVEETEELHRYCYICRQPIPEKITIRFIEFGKYFDESGVSEVWISDDVPMRGLGQTAKKRYICPLCLYEAVALSSKFRPPLLLIGLHPSATPELIDYIIMKADEKLSTLADVESAIRIFIGLKKAEGNTSSKQHDSGATQTYYTVNYFGATIIVPISEINLIRKYSEKGFKGVIGINKTINLLTLTLIPFFLDAAKGGQFGITTSITTTPYMGNAILHFPYVPNWLQNIIDLGERNRCPHKALYYGLLIYAAKTYIWRHKKKREDKERWKFLTAYGSSANFHDAQMSEIPHPSFSLMIPPPESIIKEIGERKSVKDVFELYRLILSRVREVEKMSGQKTSLRNSICSYALTMKEILPRSASKHKVTNALRKALEQYFKRIDQGYSKEDAEFAAITIFESTLRNDVGEIENGTLAKLINALKNIIALTEQEKLSEPIGALKRKTFIDETTRMIYTVFQWKEEKGKEGDSGE